MDNISLNDPTIFKGGEHAFFSLSFIDTDKQVINVEDKSVVQPVLSLNVVAHLGSVNPEDQIITVNLDDTSAIAEVRSFNLEAQIGGNNVTQDSVITPVEFITPIGDILTQEFSATGTPARAVNIPLYTSDNILPYEDLDEQSKKAYDLGMSNAQSFASNKSLREQIEPTIPVNQGSDAADAEDSRDVSEVQDYLDAIVNGNPKQGTFITLVFPEAED